MQNFFLERWIRHYEGYSSHSKVNSNGHLTIGWGRNLEKGISPDEADLMFQNDLSQAIQNLDRFAWYAELPDFVQHALINLMFTLEYEKFLGLHDFIGAIKDKNYSLAAKELLNTPWAKQIGQRAKDISVWISEAQA